MIAHGQAKSTRARSIGQSVGIMSQESGYKFWTLHTMSFSHLAEAAAFLHEGGSFGMPGGRVSVIDGRRVAAIGLQTILLKTLGGPRYMLDSL